LGPAGALTPEVCADVAAHKAEILETLRDPTGLVAPTEDVTEITETPESAISSPVEPVSVISVTPLVQEPEKPLSPEQTILCADLLRSDIAPDTCPACRQARWWTDRLSGRRVCRVCHPPSSPKVEA